MRGDEVVVRCTKCDALALELTRVRDELALLRRSQRNRREYHRGYMREWRKRSERQ